MELKQGDYMATIVTRKNGSTFVAYHRVLEPLNEAGHVVFVDDVGMRVTMLAKYVGNMRAVYPNEAHPEIDLELWRTDADQK